MSTVTRGPRKAHLSGARRPRPKKDPAPKRHRRHAVTPDGDRVDFIPDPDADYSDVQAAIRRKAAIVDVLGHEPEDLNAHLGLPTKEDDDNAGKVANRKAPESNQGD